MSPSTLDGPCFVSGWAWPNGIHVTLARARTRAHACGQDAPKVALLEVSLFSMDTGPL